MVTISTPYTFPIKKAHYQHRRFTMAQRRALVSLQQVSHPIMSMAILVEILSRMIIGG